MCRDATHAASAPDLQAFCHLCGRADPLTTPHQPRFDVPAPAPCSQGPTRSQREPGWGLGPVREPAGATRAALLHETYHVVPGFLWTAQSSKKAVRNITRTHTAREPRRARCSPALPLDFGNPNGPEGGPLEAFISDVMQLHWNDRRAEFSAVMPKIRHDLHLAESTLRSSGTCWLSPTPVPRFRRRTGGRPGDDAGWPHARNSSTIAAAQPLPTCRGAQGAHDAALDPHVF